MYLFILQENLSFKGRESGRGTVKGREGGRRTVKVGKAGWKR
jgi:hypothetical protein